MEVKKERRKTAGVLGRKNWKKTRNLILFLLPWRLMLGKRQLKKLQQMHLQKSNKTFQFGAESFQLLW